MNEGGLFSEGGQLRAQKKSTSAVPFRGIENVEHFLFVNICDRNMLSCQGPAVKPNQNEPKEKKNKQTKIVLEESEQEPDDEPEGRTGNEALIMSL